MNLLHRDELDAEAGDRLIGLFARCHSDAPLKIVYSEGVLTVLCADCRQIVEQLAVASRPPWQGNGQSRSAASCPCDGRPVT